MQGGKELTTDVLEGYHFGLSVSVFGIKRRGIFSCTLLFSRTSKFFDEHHLNNKNNFQMVLSL